MAGAARQEGQPNTGIAPTLLDYARAYAKAGLHIFPCHTAIGEHPDGYLCTCEEYRHSAKCWVQHPHLYLEACEHCANPGKHPRGIPNGLKGATCDLAQVEAWWRKYPNANIGCVPGRSGYVVLDADLYKAHFAGAELLSEEEQATPTTITGGGGKHLWFRKPEGVYYSNAPGSLLWASDTRGWRDAGCPCRSGCGDGRRGRGRTWSDIRLHLIRGQQLRVPDNLPEMPIRILKIAGVTTPEGRVGRFYDHGAGGLGLLHDIVDLGAG
jgi:hypothetical protein